MRTPVIVPPNPLTAEQYARQVGISRKRFLELQAISEGVFNDIVGKRAAERGMSIDEFLYSLRTTANSKVAKPNLESAASAAGKTQSKAKVSSSGKKRKDSNPN